MATIRRSGNRDRAHRPALGGFPHTVGLAAGGRRHAGFTAPAYVGMTDSPGLRRLALKATEWVWKRLEPGPDPTVDPDGTSQGHAQAGLPVPVYEALYESHAVAHPDETVVGELIFGPIELEILVAQGLAPTNTLVDLGCGVGRLACEVAKWMHGGAYIGTDVSDSMLRRAESRLAALEGIPDCAVRWIKQRGTSFDLPDRSVDMIAAFSVFTHIEHEDTYNFLRDGLRVIRPGGRFVFSCLPMDLATARSVFESSARLEHSDRWAQVRNVTTSVDLMDAISRMAGWEQERWIPARADYFGQTVCVLQAPPAGAGVGQTPPG